MFKSVANPWKCAQNLNKFYKNHKGGDPDPVLLYGTCNMFNLFLVNQYTLHNIQLKWVQSYKHNFLKNYDWSFKDVMRKNTQPQMITKLDYKKYVCTGFCFKAYLDMLDTSKGDYTLCNF
jgi:hypothetical protein